MLRFYNEHSQPYSWPNFYSGYNEVVYASDPWISKLPHTIEAFFLVKGHDDWNTRDAHRRFLSKYELDEHDVPLLEFDPANWDQPFVEVPAL